MTLREKQTKFAWMLGEFLLWCRDQGYEVTLGEATRSPALAKLYEQQGIGIAYSLHNIRLAVDLNLFIQGVYQKDSAAYEPLGRKWESMGGTWGGRFSKPDGNHFSLAHNGVR